MRHDGVAFMPKTLTLDHSEARMRSRIRLIVLRLHLWAFWISDQLSPRSSAAMIALFRAASS